MQARIHVERKLNNESKKFKALCCSISGRKETLLAVRVTFLQNTLPTFQVPSKTMTSVEWSTLHFHHMTYFSLSTSVHVSYSPIYTCKMMAFKNLHQKNDKI